MGLRIQLRHDTAANWAAAATVLAAGEPGWDSTNLILKVGDGVTAWAGLPTVAVSPAALSAAVDALFSVPANLAPSGLVSLGTPPAQSQTGPGKRVYLSGQLSIATGTLAGGTTMFQMPAGQFPVNGPAQFLCRTVGSNTQFQLNINAAGLVTNVGAVTVGATDTVNLDGFNYGHA